MKKEMNICTVVGARPNFIKIAPFCRAIKQHNEQNGTPHIVNTLVHTGQHYDDRMSKRFFQELDIPEADLNLGIGSGSLADQVGKTMMAFHNSLESMKPDWIVVAGDVNATLACSIVAKQNGIKLAHIEAGLRSGDMRMPEEINRLVTDRLADLLLVPDRMARENLLAEGVPENKIDFVGNIMIDTLEYKRAGAEKLDPGEIVETNRHEQFPRVCGADDRRQHAVMTLHRPSNVDQKETLLNILRFIKNDTPRETPILWTLHPRTEQKVFEFGLEEMIRDIPHLRVLHPLRYTELLRLNLDAAYVLTDSGGLQEECCVLGVPCITLRENTERPVTLVEYGGVSLLAGNQPSALNDAMKWVLNTHTPSQSPELWDGHTAPRILQALVKHLG